MGTMQNIEDKKEVVYENKPTRKESRLVAEYDDSDIFDPFSFAINKVIGTVAKWEDIDEQARPRIIAIANVLRKFA